MTLPGNKTTSQLGCLQSPLAGRSPAQLRQEEEEFLTEMERAHRTRIRQKIDDELPPFRAPWELNPKQAAPGAVSRGYEPQ